MKIKSILIAAVVVLAGCMKQNTSDTPGSPVTKEILLQQLKNTHTAKDWFVPVNPALEGLTSEQAMWRDSSGNHSIGQLAYHLAFWNERQLAKFNEQPESDFSGNNEETFTSFNQADWDKTVNKVDSVMDALEKAVSAADEKKLKDWYPILANISVHNAYHTGQIIYIRKMKGWWDPEKGVK
ncbi:MAG TPA: DinB family protein [Cyclobacteriaceae bacterium]